MNFVAIDFETANYARDSACAVGLVKVVGGEIVDKAVHLIKPPTREFVFTYIISCGIFHLVGAMARCRRFCRSSWRRRTNH